MPPQLQPQGLPEEEILSPEMMGPEAMMGVMPPEGMQMPGPPPQIDERAMLQQRLDQEYKERDTNAELVNLAENISESDLSAIGEQCIEEYQEDEESREDWLKMHAHWIQLYYQKDKPVNPPWPGSSEESIPILVEGCNQFHARAYKAFFSSPKFISATAIGKIAKEDADRAERVGLYMSWQLSIKDRSYKRNKDRLLLSLPLHGAFFTKVYRDPIRKRNVIENVRAMDLVVPYGYLGADIEEVERKTQIIWVPMRKAKILYERGFFSVMPESYTQIDNNEAQEAIDDASGIRKSSMQISGKGPAKILEQHRYLDLNNDGIEEPYIVWSDGQSRKVLRISIRYDVDVFGQPLGNFDPVEYFTHYAYLENPDGFYGLGLGHLTGSLNTAVNKLLRQCIDAGTLQNTRTGFATKNANIPKGQLEITLGKITTVEGMMDDIRKALLFLDHPGASPTLIQMMEILTQRADRLNMVTDLLTGQPDKVYQPTTALAQIEQALTTFTSVQTRLYTSLESELAKLFRLNSMYLDEQEYFSINDSMGLQEGWVAKHDFRENLQVIPTFDLQNATESAKQQRSTQTYQVGMTNPLIMASKPHMYELTKRYFESTGEVDIDAILPSPDALDQQEGEAKAMMQEQNEAMMEQQAAAMAQAEQAQRMQVEAEMADSAIEAEKLRLKESELEVKRMQVEASIADASARTQLIGVEAERKAQADNIKVVTTKEETDKKIAAEAAQKELDAAVKDRKIAADFEAKITAARLAGERRRSEKGEV